MEEWNIKMVAYMKVNFMKEKCKEEDNFGYKQ